MKNLPLPKICISIKKIPFMLGVIMSFSMLQSASAGNGQFEAKNLHALIFEMPAATAKHANEIAAKANDVSPGEHKHFDENDQRYLMLAVPAAPLPKQKFIEEYQKLEVLIDGERRVRLADYPRFFSHTVNSPEEIRGVPTIIPLNEFPEDFAGNAHDFELLHDGKSIFGPVRWLVRDERTGAIARSVNGGPGKGVVTVEMEKIDFKLSAAVMYMDNLFGQPTAVEQILPDGSSSPLVFRYVGVDMVGDQTIFREAYVEGFQAGFSRSLTIKFTFPESGKGYVAVVGQIYTTFEANRLIDVP